MILSLLVRQVFFVPLGAMLTAIAAGLFLPGYSSIAQHISEMTVLDNAAELITRSAAIITGTSVVTFSICLLVATPCRFVLTAIAAAIGGSAMISGGIFVMGHPLHGLHALALFNALVPAFFVAELGQHDKIVKLSLVASLLTLIYFWLQITNFDPHGFRGLTQRIAILVMFGWYTLAGYRMRITGNAFPDIPKQSV